MDTLEDCMQTALEHVNPARRDPNSPMPHNVTLAKPHNKEKLYKNYLATQYSDQWRKHLDLSLSNPLGRARAYVPRDWHLHNKHKCNMYKPTPYLTHQSSPYQLELLRIRSQHTIHIIPSHLHYAFRNPRAAYQDRTCPYCRSTGTTILGDELHMICHCPATKVVLEQFTAEFQGLTRLFDLPPFATSQPDAMTRLLGSPPPHILREGWIQEATPICGEFAYALRMHITSLQPSI